MAPQMSDYEQREVLQAIVIGESFDNQFDPITKETHKLLLPLVNTPLLDFSLDWLHKSGVEDVIIYCRATPFGARVKQHTESTIQRRRFTDMSVRVVTSDDIRSVGDVLRDAYSHSFITGDFILMRGDTVGNINLEKILQVHKANKKRDPKAAMTCLFTKTTDSMLRGAVTAAPVESFSDEDAYFFDDEMLKKLSKAKQQKEKPSSAADLPGIPDDSSHRITTTADSSGKILTYERLRRGATFEYPAYLAFELRNTYTTCHMGDPSITVCSVDVPGLFSDNFDCMTRDSLIKGLIQPDDLNDCSVYQYVPEVGFATTCATWADYHRISRLLCDRRLSPQCPEVSLTSGRQRYCPPMYSSQYCTVSMRDAAITSSTGTVALLPTKMVFGEAVELSPANTRVTNCVLGNLCRVSCDVILDTVYAGDNVTVEHHCTVTQCYLAPGVTLLPHTTLEPGCIVTSGVTLGPNVTLPAGSLVASEKVYNSLDEFDKEEKPTMVATDGYIYPRLGFEDSDSDRQEEDIADSDSCHDNEEDLLAELSAAGTVSNNPSADRSKGAVSKDARSKPTKDGKQHGKRNKSTTCSGLCKDSEGNTLPVWGLQVSDYVYVPYDALEDLDLSGTPYGGAEDEVDNPRTGWNAEEGDDNGDFTDEDDLDEDELKEREFRHEVMDSLVNGIKEKTDAAKVALEINASRYAYNVRLETMQAIVMECVLRCYDCHSSKADNSAGPYPAWSSCKQGLQRYIEVLQRYLRTGLDFLGTFERMVTRDPGSVTVSVKLLYELTQELELVEDAQLLAWFRRGGNGKEKPTEAFIKLHSKVAEFLTWLENAEEETSSEEDD